MALFIGQADVERLFATRHVGMLDCIEAVESARVQAEMLRARMESVRARYR